LRERGADILLLARHFLQHHAARYGKPTPVLTDAAQGVLLNYSWPGNVRELRNVIEQAVLLNTGSAITAQQLALSQLGSVLPTAPEGAASRSTPQPMAAEGTLPEMERLALVKALQLSSGNVTRAARELGISRDTLRYRIEKHGLESHARSLLRDTR
jgi:DNA-binding NtrC family response regulator